MKVNFVGSPPPKNGSPATWPELTPRQREYVRLLADGLDYRAMSHVLGITQSRVRQIAHEVRRALGMSNDRIVDWYLRPSQAAKRGHRVGCACSVCYVAELTREGRRPPIVGRDVPGIRPRQSSRARGVPVG